MNLLLALLGAAATATFAMLVVAIQKRKAPKSQYFIYLSLALLFFLLGRYIEASARSLEAAAIGIRIQYMGVPCISPLALLFVADFYDREIKAPIAALLLAPAAVAGVLGATFQSHAALYASYYFEPGPPLGRVVVAPGPYYLFLSVYYGILLLLALGVVLYAGRRPGNPGRSQNISLLIALALPMAAGALYAIGLPQPGFDLTPFALCATLIMLGIAINRMNLLQALPLAQDVLLDRMKDAFIVVDTKGRYLHANRAAKALFPVLQSTAMGARLDISGMIDRPAEKGAAGVVISIGQGEAKQYYHVSQTDVFQKDRKMCACFIFYDVTQTQNLMEEMKKQAAHDSLTGIYNHASFFDLAKCAFAEAAEKGGDAAILVADIDFFKRVNDTYGHACGDEVLRAVVKLLDRRLRQQDILGRIGGEEFGVFLADTSKEDAERVAQSLRSIVEGTELFYEGEVLRITISMGICMLDARRHNTLEELLLCADKALYRAKNSGRNKVVVYE